MNSKGEVSGPFRYRTPYVDKWGSLHDPTTWWDHLLKYYQHWVLLRVSEATRKTARPADVSARDLIREERRLMRQAQAQKLEASYLEWGHRRKQWRRRRRKRRGNGKRSRAKPKPSGERHPPPPQAPAQRPNGLAPPSLPSGS